MKALLLTLIICSNYLLASDFGKAGATLYHKTKSIYAQCSDISCFKFQVCIQEQSEEFANCSNDSYSKEEIFSNIYSLQKEYINNQYEAALFFATIGITVGVSKIVSKDAGCDGGTCLIAGLVPGILIGAPIDIVKSPLVITEFGSHRLAQMMMKKRNLKKMMLMFNPDYKNQKVKIGHTLSEAFDNL